MEVPKLTVLTAQKLLQVLPKDCLDILAGEHLKTMHIPWLLKMDNIFENIHEEEYYGDVINEFVNT